MNSVAELKSWISSNFWKYEQVTSWAKNHFHLRAHHRQTRTGASDASLPIILNSSGYVDPSFYSLTAIADDEFTLVDDGDATKKLQFQLSGITTGNTRVLTVPDFDGTLVLTAGAQSIAGVKTFSDNTLFDASVGIGTAIIAGIQLAIAAGAGRMRIDSTTNGATVAFILGAKGASGAASSSGFYYQGHETAGSRFFAFSADNSNYHLTVTNAGNVGIGNGLTAPLGKLHVDQSSTTAAIPALILDQADLSEEMIEFDTTVGAGNPVDTAALGTYYGKVRVSINGTFKYMALYNT